MLSPVKTPQFRPAKRLAVVCLSLAVLSIGCSERTAEQTDVGEDVADTRDSSNSSDVMGADARDACEDLQPRPTQRIGSQEGGWQIALNDDWSATQTAVHGDESITGAWASAEGQPVAVGLVPLELEDADTYPHEVEPKIRPALESLGTIERGFSGGEFQTHWFAHAMSGSYDVVTDQPSNVTEVRNRLYGVFSGHASDEFEPALPTDTARATSHFRVAVTTVMYSIAAGELRPVRVWAVAPEDAVAWDGPAATLMDDITNTTALSPYSQTRQEACWTYRSPVVRGRDVLVLVDTSTATLAQRDSIAATLSTMLDDSGSFVDPRLAVAPLDPANAVPSRWHRDPDALVDDLDALFAAPPAASRGIEAVRVAATKMHDGSGAIQFDPDADAIVVLLSAAEDAGMTELSEAERQAEIEETRQVLEAESIYLRGALGGYYTSCPGEASDAYEALLSNYMIEPYNLCEEIDAYDGLVQYTTPYVFPDTPISGSLRVFSEGVELPRSRQPRVRGWFYQAQTNSVYHIREQPLLRGEQESYVVEAQVWAGEPDH
jgi:hypothetical protein